jgi:hypothetical protein
VQIVASTDVGVADEYLRHGTLFGFQHHFIAPLGIEIDTYSLDLRHPAFRQQLLGADAIRADRRVVYIRT